MAKLTDPQKHEIAKLKARARALEQRSTRAVKQRAAIDRKAARRMAREAATR